MNENIVVLKRDGSKQQLDKTKILKMTEFVTQNTNCDNINLYESILKSLKDGISTDFLHKQMTFEAINKISLEQPQWRIVAGKSQMVEDIKQKNVKAIKNFNLKKDFKVDNCKYTDFLQLMDGSYEKKWFEDFNADYLNELFKQTVVFERNFDYFIESVITIENKFLINFETPQHMFLAIAFIYARAYLEQRKLNIKSELSLTIFEHKLKEYYDLFSLRKVSAPSVILSELRKPNSNLASCFIGQFDDDLSSIMDLIKDFAMISKSGGGIGCNLDNIRAFKSWLMEKKGKATGVKPLLKVLNDLMLYANQSGVKDGAMTVSLSAWHMDIIDFLKTQQLGGEEREKSMDLFLQVIYNDTILKAMENDKEIYLFDPYETKKKFGIFLSDCIGDEFEKEYNFLVSKIESGEIELFTKIRAKDLFKEVLKTLINRGTPYAVFKDNINKVSNMKPGEGVIYGVNLCCESFSVFDTETTHTCNLLSLVLPFIEESELKKVTFAAIELLETTVYLSKTPTAASQKHNDEINAIGLGAMGLADWAAKNCLPFEYEHGQVEIEALFERISYYAIEKSMLLAKEMGAFKKFDKSKWSEGQLLGKPISEIEERHNSTLNENLDWNDLSKQVIKNGIRHGWLLAIAPNTTTSSAVGVSSSILPIYSKAFSEETKTGNITRLPLYFEEFPLNYKEYRHMDIFKINTLIGRIQFWIDAGISYEPMFDLNKPEQRSAEFIFQVYLDAWKKGIKAIYYARWIKPGLNTISEKKNECIGCAG